MVQLTDNSERMSVNDIGIRRHLTTHHGLAQTETAVDDQIVRRDRPLTSVRPGALAIWNSIMRFNHTRIRDKHPVPD